MNIELKQKSDNDETIEKLATSDIIFNYNEVPENWPIVENNENDTEEYSDNWADRLAYLDNANKDRNEMDSQSIPLPRPSTQVNEGETHKSGEFRPPCPICKKRDNDGTNSLCLTCGALLCNKCFEHLLERDWMKDTTVILCSQECKSEYVNLQNDDDDDEDDSYLKLQLIAIDKKNEEEKKGFEKKKK